MRVVFACALLTFASTFPIQSTAAPIRTTSAATGIFQSNIGIGRAIFNEAGRPGLDIATRRFPALLVYGPTTHSLVGIAIPYVERRVTLDGVEGSARGLGDIELFGTYRFWQHLTRGRRDMASLRLAVDLPTGSTSRRLAVDAPEALRRAVQPGSGSADVTAMLALSREDYRYGIDLNLGGRINTKGKGLDAGDVVFARGSGGVFLFPRQTRAKGFELGVQVEAEVRHADRSKLHGAKVPPSGGTTLTVAPGVQWILGSRALLEASVQFLAAEKLVGPQPKLDRNVLVGIRLAL